MRLFARKRDTPEFNDDSYDPDEVFEKHYESFAASVRGEINIGSEDCKQIEYTLHDGTVFILRTIAEYVVFAAPQEHIDLTWTLAASSRISQLALPTVGALKDASSFIYDFTTRYDGSEAAQRTAELVSSYTFNTLRYLDEHFGHVKTIRSIFMMDDADIQQTLQLEVVGMLPIQQIQEAFDAVFAAEESMRTELGFDSSEELAKGSLEIFDASSIQMQRPDDTSIDVVVRGIIAEHETITFQELHSVTEGLLWRDVLQSVVKLFAHDVIDLNGGTGVRALPDVDGIMTTSQEALSLQDDTHVIQGEIVLPDDDSAQERSFSEPAIAPLNDAALYFEQELAQAQTQALSGHIVEDSMFDYDDDGGFDFENLEDEYGFTTAALDDTLLTHDAQHVMRSAGVEGRIFERAVRFFQENDRLERELAALETSISDTRATLQEHKAHFGELAIHRELYDLPVENHADEIQDTKDAVHKLYFTLSSKEEERDKLNTARQEVLQEVHTIIDRVHADGVQGILNRIENKIDAIEQSTNVAYQSDDEEAEALLAETHNTVVHDNVLGTPLFDKLARRRSIGL